MLKTQFICLSTMKACLKGKTAPFTQHNEL